MTRGIAVSDLVAERRAREDALTITLLADFVELFAKSPKVLSVRWQQYTPYHNGCDPCEFGVDQPTFLIEGVDSGYHPYYGWREPRDAEERILKDALICLVPMELFNFANRAAFQSVFGDHVVVTMYRDLSVDIEDCIHD